VGGGSGVRLECDFSQKVCQGTRARILSAHARALVTNSVHFQPRVRKWNPRTLAALSHLDGLVP
jgi:hypothetical protein